MIFPLILFLFLRSMLGMILERHLSLKSFIRYELFSLAVSSTFPPCTDPIDEMIIVLHLLFTPTLEVVIGSSVLTLMQD